MRSKSIKALPISVKRLLSQLGDDIRLARIRRRLPTAIVADRAFISRSTLGKVERGDPTVAMGIYATVLFVLGLAERLKDLVALPNDPTGMMLEEESLPKRVRLRKQK